MNVGDIRKLFKYTEWANAKLVGIAETLSDEQFTRDLKNSFPSIRDTLAHIIAAEWIWLRRWKGENPRGMPAWAVTSNLQELKQHLRDVERERAGFLAELTDDELSRTVSYNNLKGEPWEYQLVHVLQHLANHSTYHRGQLVTMFRQVGAAPPSTDLLIFRDETSGC